MHSLILHSCCSRRQTTCRVNMNFSRTGLLLQRLHCSISGKLNSQLYVHGHKHLHSTHNSRLRTCSHAHASIPSIRPSVRPSAHLSIQCNSMPSHPYNTYPPPYLSACLPACLPACQPPSAPACLPTYVRTHGAYMQDACTCPCERINLPKYVRITHRRVCRHPYTCMHFSVFQELLQLCRPLRMCRPAQDLFRISGFHACQTPV